MPTRHPAPFRRAALLVLLLLGAVSACTVPVVGAAVGIAADGTALTTDDGYLPPGGSLSPFADEPAISNLQADLRDAVQEAARAAAADGVDLHVSSGWRSAAYQQALFDDAVAEYGSESAARAYVLRPEESEHVTGDAVDVGPAGARDWLRRHGAAFGLCQTYGNEPWHFELATTPGTECPPPLADARAG